MIKRRKEGFSVARDNRTFRENRQASGNWIRKDSNPSSFVASSFADRRLNEMGVITGSRKFGNDSAILSNNFKTLTIK